MKIKKSFIVFSVIVLLLFAAVMELGKNTILGWCLMIGVAAAAFCLHVKFFKDKKFYVRLPLFLLFIAALCCVFFVSAPPAKLMPAVDAKNPEVTDVVHVAQGDLTGVYTEEKDVEVFAGIPYAQPPVGELRWKAPQAPEAWEGVRACDTFAPKSMQNDSHPIMETLTRMVGYHTFRISLKDNYVEPMSEDSLYLNVWKPAGDVSGLPVLFFIHGGSLTSGNTWYTEYNGESLAKKGIIVVNCAYRLNIFGYYANELLAEESADGAAGNYGLLDQIAALKWVNENIEAFGGDPSNITIAGESAGSSSVNAICVSPLAKGLFKRAIAESSGINAKVPYHTFRAFSDLLKTGKKTMEELGAETLEDLRAIPAEELVRYGGNYSSLTVDGYSIVEQPYLTYEKGNNNEEVLMNGFNVHEADFFDFSTKVTSENYLETLRNFLGDYADEAIELYPAEPVEKAYKLAIVEQGGDAKGSFNKILSACWFTYSHNIWSRQLAKNGTTVYEYWFTKDNGSLGSAHGGEMPYAYGNLDAHKWLYDASDYELSEIMQNYWVNFVKTGDPNGEGLPTWEKFNDDETKVLELGATVGMTEDPNLALYRLIDLYQDSIAK